MKGKYAVTVRNNTLCYQFEIRRNITVIKGDSATGKTTLIEMIREFYEDGKSSGIELNCDKECAVLEGRNWNVILQSMHDCIIFIDEGNSFVMTDEFSDAVRKSDNYFVIVTRENLPNLPYSVTEVYGIRSSGKYGVLKQTYQEFYRIYGDISHSEKFCPENVIVEDSNSGYEFFSEILKDKSCKVISACGKSNIFKLLKELKNERNLVIADGAAFGPEMDRVMKKINLSSDNAVFLPESFEWLILKSKIFRNSKTENMLDFPENYIESSEYMSWERFFTAYLIDETNDTYLQYSKTKLNSSYLNDKVKSKIIDVIPDVLNLSEKPTD